MADNLPLITLFGFAKKRDAFEQNVSAALCPAPHIVPEKPAWHDMQPSPAVCLQTNRGQVEAQQELCHAWAE
jgi:hypothetical protein